MKITLQNSHVPSKAITILVQDRLQALGRLRPIRAVNLLISRGPPDSQSYQVRAELYLGGEALVADAGSPSFRAAFERVLLQLQTLLLRRHLKHPSISKNIHNIR